MSYFIYYVSIYPVLTVFVIVSLIELILIFETTRIVTALFYGLEEYQNKKLMITRLCWSFLPLLVFSFGLPLR